MERNLILIFAGILLHQINGQQMELVAGHVLFRHGDRTPISIYRSNPIQKKDWPDGSGQLTIKGVQQQYRLGKYLRTRYGSILSQKYSPSEIYIRSTGFNRTLMSALSNLIGLYSLSDVSNNNISIHTVPLNQDLLLSIGVCPRINEIHGSIIKSDEVKKLNAYYKPFFKKLQIWTNVPKITLYTNAAISDTTLIEHIYNKTPAWATDDVRKTLTDIRDIQCQLLFSNDDSNRIRGGPLIKDIWMNMNNSRHGEPYWKVKMYSAHDVTVSPVLFFLGIKYPHIPKYASAVFVDLYKQNSSYFVKVEFLNVTDSNIAHGFLIPGCPSLECPLDIFTSIYYPRFPANINSECSE